MEEYEGCQVRCGAVRLGLLGSGRGSPSATGARRGSRQWYPVALARTLRPANPRATPAPSGNAKGRLALRHPPPRPKNWAIIVVLALLLVAITAPAALAKPKGDIKQSEIQQTQGFRNAVTLAGVREHQAAWQAISTLR